MKIGKNKWLLVLLACLLFLAGCGAGAGTETVDTGSAKETLTGVDALKEQIGFYVEGTTLYDANGNPFIMRGVNHAHTWYLSQMTTALDAIAETGSNTVRLVLADGEQWSANSANGVSVLIQMCKERDLIAVLEVHDATGNNNEESLLAAAQYFVDIKDSLIGEEDYVIINIANEWRGDRNATKWAEAYKKAIPMLRDAGLAHTIMIDCAGWGQYGKCVNDKGEEVLATDPLSNVMFSVHMYGSAGGTEEKIETNLKYATDLNLCICVGEFGYTHSDGDVKEDYLMQYCVDNEIGYLAWSWKGNGGGVEYLDIAVKWDGSELSKDWGENVVNGKNGIRETSKICTVFENVETE